MGDKLKRLSGKPISGQIRQYYKHNHVNKFLFSRPYHRPEEPLEGSKDDLTSVNEFATRWLERTELEISDMLPGILRWFPVVKQRTFWVSPVEAAVEALTDANRALKALVLEARANDAPLQPLTMRLSGILDPAVQGGIVNYERAFLTPAYAERHPDHAPLLAQLRDLIADQIPLLQFGLEVHGARMPAALEGLHSHMLQCFRRIQNHVHQRYGRKNCDFESEAAEVQLRMQGRDRAYTETPASNRASDISTGTSTEKEKSIDRLSSQLIESEPSGRRFESRQTPTSASKSKFFSFNAAINPLARNSAAGVSNYFGTLNASPKKKERRRAAGRKSEIGTQSSGSQWYTSPVANGNASHASNTSLASQDSPLRELRQETFQSQAAARIQNLLVTERPSRVEAERERRMSQRASLITSAPPSNRDSIGTTDSNQEDEEPPPLPEKSANRNTLDSDSNNNPEPLPLPLPLPPRHNYDMVRARDGPQDTVLTPRGSFLYNSMMRRTNAGLPGSTPPTPPPKKKHAMRHS